MKGWKKVPLALLDEDAPTLARYFFIKRCPLPKYVGPSEDEQDEDDGFQERVESAKRSLLVSNIPIHFNYSNVSEVFGAFGEINEVNFQEQQAQASTSSQQQNIGCGRCAQVEFGDSSVVDRILAADSSAVVHCQPYNSGDQESTGMTKWLCEYAQNRPNTEKLLHQVERFMAAFDEREQQEAAMRRGAPVVDDEGFTQVISKKKRKIAPVVAEASSSSKKSKKEKKSEQLVGFYKFEEREKKQQQLDLLRLKFEEDKKRVQKMKEHRLFRQF
jgi:RNA recognition motif-containing protein